MSKRNTSRSKRKKQANSSRQNSNHKAAAAKRRNIAHRSKSSRKPSGSAAAQKVTETQAELSLDEAENLLNTSAEKAGLKPSKDTMRVSLKAPGVGEAEPSLKEQQKLSKDTMRVSLKAPVSSAAAEEPSKKIANKVAQVHMGDTTKSKGRPKNKRKKGGAKQAHQKKEAKKQSFTAVEKPQETGTAGTAASGISKDTMRVSLKAPSAGGGLPKETMRVSLKAPGVGGSGGVPKETMRVNLKAPVAGGVNPETHAVQASSNPFVRNTREGGDALANAPAPQPEETIAPAQKVITQSVTQKAPVANSKGALADILMILGYALGFLAVILLIWHFFIR